ncbi:MAG: hypothetical protein KC777_11015 [Cyanobacteria bacterium HKST-UBA02]|nr:hypothetical protein [Cyanobacteria bacterium HKST-UBA02]
MQIHKPTLKLISLIALATFAIPPSGAATSYMSRAMELYNSGHYGKAKETLIEIVCANPRYWPAHYQLANTYLRLNDKTAAQFEYEWCLKFCRDKKVRRKCEEAIAVLTNNPDLAPSRVALTKAREHLDKELSKIGQDRVNEARQTANQEKSQILAEGEARAKAVRNSIDSRVEQARENSDSWIFTGGIERSGMISRDTYNQIINEANDQAKYFEDEAKRAARNVKTPGQDDTTEGLRSQLAQPAGPSGVKLSPQGTNLYIRNYQTRPSTGKTGSDQEKSAKPEAKESKTGD